MWNGCPTKFRSSFGLCKKFGIVTKGVLTLLIIFKCDVFLGRRETKVKSGSWSSDTSTILSNYLENMIERLIATTHRKSMKTNYHKIWCMFNKFLIRLDKKPESWEDRLVLFAVHLIDNRTQSPTIKSYALAIKSILRLDGIVMSNDNFVMAAIIRACRLQNVRVKARFPISKSILRIMLDKLEIIYDR